MFLSGLKSLDQATNGIERGSVVEICGASDSGKSGLALWFLRESQNDATVTVGWVITETPLSSSNIRWAGLDPERLIVVQQHPGLTGLDAAQSLVRCGCSIVVVDSLAALVGDTLSSAIAEGVSQLRPVVKEKEALVILLNQERGVGRNVSSAGMSAGLLRNLDYRIHLRSGEGLFRGGVQMGMRVHFTIVQNGRDVEQWNKSGRYNCYFEKGLRDLHGI